MKSSVFPRAERLTVGLAAIADFRSIIGQEVIRGVMQACSDRDVNLVNFSGAIKYSLSDDLEFFEHYRKKYRFMHRENLDGLISWASSLRTFQTVDEISAIHERLEPLPTVLVGVPIYHKVPGVLTRSQDGVRAVMDHLIGHHGYRRIGFFGVLGSIEYQSRLEAYQRVLQESGIAFDPSVVWMAPSLEPKDIRKVAEQVRSTAVRKNKQATEAIVTVSDSLAIELVEEFERAGIKVPADVAVTGFNNQLQSMRAPTPLTTVNLGFFEQGYQAVLLLLELIDKRRSSLPDPPTLTLPSTLVVRQSCGCFEGPVEQRKTSGALDVWDGQEDLTEALTRVVQTSFPNLVPGSSSQLARSLAVAVREGTNTSFLTQVREAYASQAYRTTESTIDWHRLFSDLRYFVQPGLRQDPTLLCRLEDALHQARILVAVLASYTGVTARTDTYLFTALAKIAIEFASAHDGKEILLTLRRHLDELEMPGIWLVLQDRLQKDLGIGTLVLSGSQRGDGEVSLPDSDDTARRIQVGRLVPSRFLPRDRRWSMMMEILYHRGRYIGFAMIEMGPENISLYDSVRTLLSFSLYNAYLREGRFDDDRDRQSLLRAEPIRSILEQDGSGRLQGDGLSAQEILDHLIAHLGEMTNLDAFAADLNLSKSHLIKKTKQLTGYTVQSLHEILKIERAKLLLDLRTMKISEVAQRLGFQNQFYFSKVFHKRTGQSPSGWMTRNGR